MSDIDPEVLSDATRRYREQERLKTAANSLAAQNGEVAAHGVRSLVIGPRVSGDHHLVRTFRELGYSPDRWVRIWSDPEVSNPVDDSIESGWYTPFSVETPLPIARQHVMGITSMVLSSVTLNPDQKIAFLSSFINNLSATRAADRYDFYPTKIEPTVKKRSAAKWTLQEIRSYEKMLGEQEGAVDYRSIFQAQYIREELDKTTGYTKGTLLRVAAVGVVGMAGVRQLLNR